MAHDGDILVSSNLGLLINAVKRVEPESAKAMKKELDQLGTRAKRQLTANTPVRTGFAKGQWSKKSSVTKTKVKVAVTIKWPSGVPRYPFMLEHGRKAGLAGHPSRGRRLLARVGLASGPRQVTEMAPRRYIAKTRQQMAPDIARTTRRIEDACVRALEMKG